MRRLLILFAALAAGAASAQDLKELLDKGQVVLVETDSKGRFKQATAIIQVNRPPDEVWRIVREPGNYKSFVPKVVRSDAKKLSDTQLDVEFEIEVPGANTVYTFRYDVDDASRTLKGHWVKGDLKNSSTEWKVVPFGTGSLVYHANSSKNFSSLAESFEDDQQTVTVGVNVGAALASAKAVKDKAEAAGTTASAQPAGAK